jgi:hypothetical protein
MAQESSDTTANAVKSVGFVQKIVNYFNESDKSHPDKKFDISFIGGPYYSSDTSFGIGLVAAGLYRTNMADTITPISNVSLYGQLSVTLYYQVGIEGNHIFRNDSKRINYKAYFLGFPDKYWGVGYEQNVNNNNETKYKRYQARFKGDIVWNILPNFYIGPQLLADYTNAHGMQNTELWSQRLHVFSIGAGISLQYDTRDHLTNPYKGCFLRLEQMSYPKAIGNRYAFSSTELIAKWYHAIWKGGIIATQLHALFNYGNTPWNMMGTIGGSHTMRGYYEGRYNDKCIMDATLELRQHVWRRNGLAVWAGIGEVAPKVSKFTIHHLLPNYGVGYRWQFKTRVNVRLDLGFGKDQMGIVFNVHEAF